MRYPIFVALGLFTSFMLLAVACEPKEDIVGPISPTEQEGNLDTINYSPTSYQFPAINGLPAMEVPADNPMTEEAILLGRYLFYEKMLSIDNSISCGSCHQQDKAFTDGLAKAEGVGGTLGTRNSMSLINVGYNFKANSAHNFNWDGAFRTLEEQAIAPVEHPLEMMNTWDEVETRLRNHSTYPCLFRKAFGISDESEITRELATKAIAQFLRTLNSAGSMYDEHEFTPFVFMSEEAQRGMQIFLGDEGVVTQGKDGECAHCHNFTRNSAIFARNGFSNNAIDSVGGFNEFTDLGLGAITGNAPDNGKFREVTLRNIALTAPYMHDGRFATLEEVMEHYVTGNHAQRGPNVGSELAASSTLPQLTQQDVDDVISFLHALTDTSYVNRPEWSDPFDQTDPFDGLCD